LERSVGRPTLNYSKYQRENLLKVTRRVFGLNEEEVTEGQRKVAR
jgi:hypothetical protein